MGSHVDVGGHGNDIEYLRILRSRTARQGQCGHSHNTPSTTLNSQHIMPKYTRHSIIVSDFTYKVTTIYNKIDKPNPPTSRLNPTHG